MSLSPWRAALRIARRETLRAKGRSLLVIALIGLPVAAIGYGTVLYDSFSPTPQERVDRELGHADAAVMKHYDVPVQQLPTELGAVFDDEVEGTEAPATERDILALLPPGSRAIPDRVGEAAVGTRTGVGRIGVRELDYADPIASGLLTQLSGRAPRGPGEVALTEAASRRTGLGVGDRLEVVEPDKRRYTVVGIVEEPGDLRSKEIIGRPGSLPGVGGDATRWLVDTPSAVSWPDVQAMNREGAVALSRAVLLDPPPDSEVPAMGSYGARGPQVEAISLLAIVVGTAVLEIVLLAGPAFAIGARRRQRDIALVAVSGATPRQLRRVLLADGVVLGLLGAGFGLALAIATAATTLPLLEEYVMHVRAGGFRVLPLGLLGIAALATVTGLLAAVLPAFLASRTDVVAALAGRRGITRSRRRWLALGLLTTGVGAAAAGYGATRTSTALVMGGLVLIQLGLALCTPSVIGAVSRLSGWLPLAPRIAMRNTSRVRGAAAPAIAAVMAAVAAAVTIGMLMHSEQTRQETLYRPALPDGYAAVGFNGSSAATRDPDRVVDIVRRTLPVSEPYVLQEAGCPKAYQGDCLVALAEPESRRCRLETASEPSPDEMARLADDPRCQESHDWQMWSPPTTLVDGGSGLGLLSSADPDQLRAARKVLDAGGVVLSNPDYVTDGRATLEVSAAADNKSKVVASSRAPAYLLPHGTLSAYTVIVSPKLAAELELTQRPSVVVARPEQPITVADEDRLTAQLRTLGEEPSAYVERGPGRADDAVLLILGAIAGVITLGAAAIATGLVAADGRPELATLAAVGASPGLRRWLMLSQSGVIAGLGTLLGALSGIGAAAVLIVAMNQAAITEESGQPPLPIAVPWLVLLITVVVVPLVAMLGAGLLTRSRLPVERRLA